MCGGGYATVESALAKLAFSGWWRVGACGAGRCVQGDVSLSLRSLCPLDFVALNQRHRRVILSEHRERNLQERSTVIPSAISA